MAYSSVRQMICQLLGFELCLQSGSRTADLEPFIHCWNIYRCFFRQTRWLHRGLFRRRQGCWLHRRLGRIACVRKRWLHRRLSRIARVRKRWLHCDLLQRRISWFVSRNFRRFIRWQRCRFASWRQRRRFVGDCQRRCSCRRRRLRRRFSWGGCFLNSWC